jgi:hypothetical protein
VICLYSSGTLLSLRELKASVGATALRLPIPFTVLVRTALDTNSPVIGYYGVAYIGLWTLFTLDLKAEAPRSGRCRPSTFWTVSRRLCRIRTDVSVVSGTCGTLCSEGNECESTKCEKDTTFSYSRCVGVECKEDKDCGTGRCDSGLCLPKLGSCVACNEDTDCAGNHCLQFRCSGENGLMDDNCNCNLASDCNSGRCEGLAPPVCEAQLGGSKSSVVVRIRQNFICNKHRMECVPVAATVVNHCSWRLGATTDAVNAASLVSENTGGLGR